MKIDIGQDNITKIVRHESIEIIINANDTPTEINFPDNPNLRKCFILGLEFFPSELVRTSPTNISTITIAALTSNPMYVTLQNYKGSDFCERLPYTKLVPAAFGFGTNLPQLNFSRDFIGQMVNWPKSRVNFPSALAAAGTPRSLLFSVYYINPNLDIPKK